MPEVTEADSVAAQKVAASTVLLFVRRGVLTGASGIAGILIARWLQPTGYGQLQSALATWTLLIGFADFGFSLSLSRDFASQKARSGTLLRTAYRVQGLVSVAMALILVGIALVVGVGTTRGLCLLVLAPSVIFSTFTSGRSYYTAIFDVSVTVRIDIVVVLLQIGSMVALAAGGAGAVGVAAAVSVGTMSSAGLIGLAALRATDSAGEPVRMWDVVAPALPLGLISTMSRLYISADVVILGFLLSGAQVGVYAAAAKILVLLNTLPNLLMTSALPAFANALASSSPLDGLVNRFLQWSLAVMLPAFLITMLYPHTLIDIVLGHAFDQSADLLRVLCLAGILGLLGQIIGSVLVAYRTVRVMVAQNAVAAALNVGLNLWLLPVYGVSAAAWITVGTELFVVGASYLTMRRHIDVDFRIQRFLLRPILVVLPAAVGAVVWGEGRVVLLLVVVTLPVVYLLARGWPDDLLPSRWRGSRWTWVLT